FSLDEITAILAKVAQAVGPCADVFVLEPFWDTQRFEASAYTLRAVSLYFACMANGNSKMYRFEELTRAVSQGGFTLQEARHDIGANCYSLLRFRKKA
ncbi:MAG: class I SAM-dependent methyltransferase, partial [Spirochaetaceae bacterium]|nr:class I SAM-dependent methyltransferase [Spirochaetaceae bacterium]